MGTNDNAGLWTSAYLASQCYRYAATRGPMARASAWRAFEGLELLNNSTGVDGYMARDVLQSATLPNTSTCCKWTFSETNPRYVWLGDTSSDELTGHLFAADA